MSCSIQEGYAHGHGEFVHCTISRHLTIKTQGGSYKPKVRQFDVGDFVYFQQQPNDTLDIFFSHTILRIKAIMPSGVLELQGVDARIIQDHSKNCVPCHMPNLDPTIITSI